MPRNNFAWLTDDAIAANPVLVNSSLAHLPYALRILLSEEDLSQYYHRSRPPAHSFKPSSGIIRPPESVNGVKETVD